MPDSRLQDLVAELRVSLAGIRLPVRINLVRLHSDATLSNRFGVGGILRADAGSAILSADDDILIRPQGVAVALAAWKRTPDRIVGGTTCGFASGKQKKAAMEPAFAGNLAQNSWRPAAYSPVFPMMRNTSCVFQLTGFAILHKNYLGRYWSREPAMREARAYVAAQLNAEVRQLRHCFVRFSPPPPPPPPRCGTWDCKHQSASDKHGRLVQHIARRVCGGGTELRNMVKNDVEVAVHQPLLSWPRRPWRYQ